METTQAYYVSKIKECLSVKQKENPYYSQRNFAKDLGVHPGTLAHILRGTRPLPYKIVDSVVNNLRLSPKERALFLGSLTRTTPRHDSTKTGELDESFMKDESFYKVLAEWEHVAILELFNLHGFKGSLDEIVSKLSLSKNRAEVALNHLTICGLLVVDKDGSLSLAHPELRISEDIKNQALRGSHIEAMKMGIEKIDSVEFGLKDFSSTTIALSLDKLPEVKMIISEFRLRISNLLKDSDQKTDVFQLAIQFFPLTEVIKKH